MRCRHVAALPLGLKLQSHHGHTEDEGQQQDDADDGVAALVEEVPVEATDACGTRR